MASSYTSLLGLALPVTGELSGSWGDVVNDSITSLLDTAVAGTTTLSTDGDVTLSTTTGASNQARQAILLCSGARTALRTITAPAQSKIYTVINATTGGFSVKVVGAGPTTGVTIVAGESAVIAWNGSDFVKISNTGGGGSFTNVTISGTTTLSGLTASTALALNSSKEVVSVTNTGTGNNVLATSPTLVTPALGTPSSVTLTNATGLPISTGVSGLGTGIATALAVNVGSDGAPVLFNGALGTPSSGTVTNLTGTASININGTVGATTASTGAFTTLTTSSTVTLNGGTANGVAYLNGSKVLTSGSALTFDGRVFTVDASAGNAVISAKAITNQAAFLSAVGNGNTQGTTSFDIIQDQTYAYVFNRANTPMLFGINNAEAMRLTSTGLGIGTSSPTNALSVSGNANITGNTTLGDASTDTVTVNGYMSTGGAVNASFAMYPRNTALTGTTQAGVYSAITGASDATSAIYGVAGDVRTAAAAFTVTNVSQFFAADATKGAGSTITNQHGVRIADQTQGTNNYGITSLVSSGANKWNIYASGTANNAFAGNVRIGSTTAPTNALDVTGAMTVSGNTTLGDASTDTVTVNGYMGVGGAAASSVGVFVTSAALTGVNQTGVLSTPTATSAATTSLRPFYSDGATVAASFTLAEFSNFYAGVGVKGAGSTITNKYGLRVVNQSIGDNNFGVASEVSSGTNKWNIYASGTAANYFAGNTSFGTTTVSSVFGTTVRVGNTSIGGCFDLPGGRLYTAASTNNLNLVGGIGSDGDIVFARAGGSESMRINSSGNVGIGTSSPTAKAQITKAALTGFVSRTAATLTLENSGDTELYFASGNANVGQLRFGDDGGNFRGAISYDHLSDGFLFYTAGTERMRLDSSGNLGLGVTPSSWGGSYKALQIGNRALAQTGAGAGDWTMAFNAVYDATDSRWEYIYTGDSAVRYSQTGAGIHAWFTAPSGTAGNAISFTQAMTLDASGRLLVGLTSSNTALGGKLQVEGTTDAFSSLVRYSSSAGGAPVAYLARSKSATLGTNTIVASGDTLGSIAFSGANGTGYSDAAYIQAFVDGTPGASADMPGRLVFATSADGSATPAERMRIDSSGNLIQTVNTTAATLATNNTLTFSIVDNSTLRISVRGSDGTTRTATVALT